MRKSRPFYREEEEVKKREGEEGDKGRNVRALGGLYDEIVALVVWYYKLPPRLRLERLLGFGYFIL